MCRQPQVGDRLVFHWGFILTGERKAPFGNICKNMSLSSVTVFCPLSSQVDSVSGFSPDASSSHAQHTHTHTRLVCSGVSLPLPTLHLFLILWPWAQEREGGR